MLYIVVREGLTKHQLAKTTTTIEENFTTEAGLQIPTDDRWLSVIFVLSPVKSFELFGKMLVQYLLSYFHFCEEVKPVSYSP